jgi:hypothetical protein
MDFARAQKELDAVFCCILLLCGKRGFFDWLFQMFARGSLWNMGAAPSEGF